MNKLIALTLIVVVALAAAGIVLAADTAATAAATVAPAAAPATAPAAPAMNADKAKKAQQALDRGVAFILSQRNDAGGWGFEPGKSHPGLTAIVLKALLRQSGYGPDHVAVRKGFEELMKSRQGDGGFYNPQEGNANYCTSLAVMALAAGGSAHKPALDDAIKFLRGQQIAPGSKTPNGDTVDAKHPFGGGVSYGKQGRPDLSNQGFWMEALHEAGVGGDDEAMQRALAFVQRVQNRTEGSEGQSFVVKGEDDGGFIYAIEQKDGQFVGASAAGDSDRGLRSYGSMTYTGFKSMLYANLRKDDPRVKAAFDWIRKNWRLDTNPNMPEAQSRQGLYYYYMVFAKALRTYGQDVITDGKGAAHNWREELADALIAQQKPDGSWANEADRWNEGSPTLVTCYSALALQEALPK